MVRYSLPLLPYGKDALAPLISAETLSFHYGKHHQAYVDKLNDLISKTPYGDMELADVVKKSTGAVFNNAAQHWNHSFYWQSLSETKHQTPKGALADAITKDFGSYAEFEKKFTEVALAEFGSGWIWLTRDTTGKLKVEMTPDADNPIHTGSGDPLFTCDVWEHAYYIDYRNARAKYAEAFFKILNWRFAEENFSTAIKK